MLAITLLAVEGVDVVEIDVGAIWEVIVAVGVAAVVAGVAVFYSWGSCYCYWCVCCCSLSDC